MDSKISFAELSRKRVRDRLFGRFKDSKIQGFKNSRISFAELPSVGSKIQKFNSAKTGKGFKKYSVAFCVSVFWWRQNIRVPIPIAIGTIGIVAKRFKLTVATE